MTWTASLARPLKPRDHDPLRTLADARAMESAGADSLWLDDEGYDPWLLLAGMATVTSRIRLIVPVSSAERRDPQTLGVRVATLSRLSRGRTALAVTGIAESSVGVDAVIELARRAQCCAILETAGDRRRQPAAL